MAYSDFTLQEVAQRFQLVIEEQHNLFAAVPEVIPGDFLCAILDENVPLALALSTEKARSELMLAPVLVEVRKLARRHISLFSELDAFPPSGSIQSCRARRGASFAAASWGGLPAAGGKSTDMGEASTGHCLFTTLTGSSPAKPRKLYVP